MGAKWKVIDAEQSLSRQPGWVISIDLGIQGLVEVDFCNAMLG
jgi:hypothetical protein